MNNVMFVINCKWLVNEQSMEEVGSDESPYIGKGRYQQRQLPREQRPPSAQQLSNNSDRASQRVGHNQSDSLRPLEGNDSSLPIALLEQQLAEKTKALKDG